MSIALYRDVLPGQVYRHIQCGHLIRIKSIEYNSSSGDVLFDVDLSTNKLGCYVTVNSLRANYDFAPNAAFVRVKAKPPTLAQGRRRRIAFLELALREAYPTQP